MAWVETRITRTTQPQDAVGIDRSSKFGARVLDGFVGNDRRTELDKSITQYGSLTAAAAPFGVGKKGAGDAGFSFPSDLSAHNGITIVFSYVQHSRASDQVLFEHSVNQNPNAGAFIFYTSAATNRLNFGTSAGNVYDAGYVTAPALGSVATCVVRMRRTSSVVAADDIALWINGVQPAFTSQTVNGATVNFGNYETYFLGRAGTTLRADATIGGYHVLQGFASDADCAELSSNHWQIFEPEVSRIWVDDYVSAGGVTQVQSDASLNYVLQAITFQSQGGMYSILGLVNADINSSYYVNEARVNSSSASYVIQNAIAKDQNEEYNVLASLSNTQGSTYNVRSALSQDQGSTYFISESTYREQLVDYVIRSAQFNDQGGTYNILSANTVGNNANLNYVISALIQQDQQENYSVRSSSHQETNGIYTIRASAENSTEGSYIVRGSLSSEAQLDYTVRAEVNSEGTLSYTIRASLSKDQGLMYDILAANNVSSSSGGSYIIQATTANNTSCSYQVQGEVIDVPLTNAEMQQLYAWVSELVTKSATKEEIATAVWSKPTSELTVENSIGKWLMQKVLTVSKFLALK